jgi:hypothetical protein
MGIKCKKSFKYVDQEIMKSNIKTSLTNVFLKIRSVDNYK